MKASSVFVGQKYGRLTVVSFSRIHKRYRWWNCICECGKQSEVRSSRLIEGATRSCGCLAKELKSTRCRLLGLKQKKHGHARKGHRTREYESWAHMIRRCTNPRSANWQDYGGRGIKICKRWRNSFENFLADMGKKPSPELTLERKDNYGNYEPGNCIWATRKEQRWNQRPRKRHDYCKKGHPMSGENVILYPSTRYADGKRRFCRQCVKDLYERKKKNAA